MSKRSSVYSKCDIRCLEQLVADNVDEGRGPYYAEVGRYKPWNMSVLLAAERRGYRVEKVCEGVYYVHPKVDQTVKGS